MDEQVTPSQAEGERDDEDATTDGRADFPHPTPSQAEGERDPEPGEQEPGRI
ncbi:hypothetical protein [Streptomyces sp. B3I8]|uniref:hypothetical protein n=1 Tax=Streptomyces sp. B3I8 TaxID=3042303 RepID=UPI00278466F9|nr:hypothetical protein [Streptomyces sp. B3I8]MDQ0789963.1 hypothetical protein [Streptomyces sp. B3I8]